MKKVKTDVQCTNCNDSKLYCAISLHSSPQLISLQEVKIMTYFKAKADAYDHFSHRGVVAGELLTAKERAKLFPCFPDCLFETVVIPKSKTFTSFGVRKEVNREER